MSLKDALKVYKLNYNRCLDGEQKEQKDTLDTILLLPNFHPLVFNLILRRINLEIKRSGAWTQSFETLRTKLKMGI